MKGILWYVTRKLEGIFDGILMEFRMRISEDKNQTQKSMYIPRLLSSGLYGSHQCHPTSLYTNQKAQYISISLSKRSHCCKAHDFLLDQVCLQLK